MLSESHVPQRDIVFAHYYYTLLFALLFVIFLVPHSNTAAQ
jgi:hypothetical protein